jgi:hypothetical protein
MSLRVYNAPEVERIQTANIFRPSEVNRDRNFGSGYAPSSLGTDALKLSGDYGGKKSSRSQDTAYYSYANLFRLLLILIGMAAVIITGMVVLVALGGLISLVVAGLLVFLSVFLYSINLNPFDKSTYKKMLGYLY